jgi:hypothetical protein
MLKGMNKLYGTSDMRLPITVQMMKQFACTRSNKSEEIFQNNDINFDNDLFSCKEIINRW